MVVTYAPDEGEGASEHEIASRVEVAKALAALQGLEFGGGYDPSLRGKGALYFVPGRTLVREEAASLGIAGPGDLFGGVVPYPFVADKAIAHPLAAPGARRPRGWSDAFAQRVRDVVLPGFSAFSREDARRAARRLLARGPVRVKRARGIGGKGQAVIHDVADPALEALDGPELEERGVVLEPDLTDITTYSVGQVCVGAIRASYCGTQRQTRDNAGQPAYGGSDLLVVRGELEALERLELAPGMRCALRQARAFDAAAAEFEGFFASRRNYDVLCGRDAAGRRLSGVLEQSWRIGGASSAEAAALAALRADPGLHAVRARSTEAYGAEAPPPGARVHFRGVDRRVGPITKYTLLERYEAGKDRHPG